MEKGRGFGRSIFASVLLMIGGVLNIVYGIGAISKSHFFTVNAHYVFGDLKTWGWITLLLGIDRRRSWVPHRLGPVVSSTARHRLAVTSPLPSEL